MYPCVLKFIQKDNLDSPPQVNHLLVIVGQMMNEQAPTVVISRVSTQNSGFEFL